jgi:aspartate 1-decarboxylase
MFREMLQGKIHRGVVTACRIDYAGSLTVDIDLIERIGLLVHQKIQLLNISNGNRLETYLIAGERGKREIQVNGAAARLNQPGDRIIIAGFAFYTDAELKDYRPKVVVLDEKNQIIDEH